MFFLKRSKIVVDCFTDKESVFNLYKIRKATAFFPDEIKNVPAMVPSCDQQTNIEFEMPTIKRCNGIQDLYKNGAIIPFWTTFISQPKKHSEGQSTIGMLTVPYSFNTHPKIQYPGILEDCTHVKFSGVWNLREKTGIKFVWQSAFWNLLHHKDHFLVPPAIVDYKRQAQTNVNVFINNNCEKFTIEGGEPMVHLIPMTEKTVEYKCHLVTEKEFDKINPVPNDYGFLATSRFNKYYNHLNKSKEMDKKEKKCPFSG